MSIPQAEGCWEQKWTLTGTSDSEVVLPEAEIWQKTIRARYKADKCRVGWNQLVESLMFHKGWEYDEAGNPTTQTFWYIPVS